MQCLNYNAPLAKFCPPPQMNRSKPGAVTFNSGATREGCAGAPKPLGLDISPGLPPTEWDFSMIPQYLAVESPMNIPIPPLRIVKVSEESRRTRKYDPEDFESLRSDCCHTPIPVLAWLVRLYHKEPNMRRPAHLKLLIDELDDSDIFGGCCKAKTRHRATRKLNQKVMSVLSRITAEKYNELCNEMLELPLKQSTTAELKEVVDVFFTKAVREHTFSNLYAKLVADICQMSESEKSLDQAAKEKLIGHRMRTELLSTCSREFSKPLELNEDDLFEKDTGVRLSEDAIQEKKDILRRKLIGNIKFVGELYKNGLITDNVIISIFEYLVGNYDVKKPTVREDYVFEIFVTLFATVGKMIYAARPDPVHFFMELNRNIIDTHPVNRVKFMCMDLKDMYEKGFEEKKDISAFNQEKENSSSSIHSSNFASSRQLSCGLSSSQGGSTSSYSRNGNPSLTASNRRSSYSTSVSSSTPIENSKLPVKSKKPNLDLKSLRTQSSDSNAPRHGNETTTTKANWKISITTAEKPCETTKSPHNGTTAEILPCETQPRVESYAAVAAGTATGNSEHLDSPIKPNLVSQTKINTGIERPKISLQPIVTTTGTNTIACANGCIPKSPSSSLLCQRDGKNHFMYDIPVSPLMGSPSLKKFQCGVYVGWSVPSTPMRKPNSNGKNILIQKKAVSIFSSFKENPNMVLEQLADLDPSEVIVLLIHWLHQCCTNCGKHAEDRRYLPLLMAMILERSEDTSTMILSSSDLQQTILEWMRVEVTNKCYNECPRFFELWAQVVDLAFELEEANVKNNGDKKNIDDKNHPQMGRVIYIMCGGTFTLFLRLLISTENKSFISTAVRDMFTYAARITDRCDRMAISDTQKALSYACLCRFQLLPHLMKKDDNNHIWATTGDDIELQLVKRILRNEGVIETIAPTISEVPDQFKQVTKLTTVMKLTAATLTLSLLPQGHTSAVTQDIGVTIMHDIINRVPQNLQVAAKAAAVIEMISFFCSQEVTSSSNNSSQNCSISIRSPLNTPTKSPLSVFDNASAKICECFTSWYKEGVMDKSVLHTLVSVVPVSISSTPGTPYRRTECFPSVTDGASPQELSSSSSLLTVISPGSPALQSAPVSCPRTPLMGEASFKFEPSELLVRHLNFLNNVKWNLIMNQLQKV
eukprot:Tbor_TRINITY_DN2210_c0_g1::TRINITY_DN2210_c0_g1_i1::g.2775::m.2775/K03260/EIF4G; translation initiation factor 4G